MGHGYILTCDLWHTPHDSLTRCQVCPALVISCTFCQYCNYIASLAYVHSSRYCLTQSLIITKKSNFSFSELFDRKKKLNMYLSSGCPSFLLSVCLSTCLQFLYACSHWISKITKFGMITGHGRWRFLWINGNLNCWGPAREGMSFDCSKWAYFWSYGFPLVKCRLTASSTL